MGLAHMEFIENYLIEIKEISLLINKDEVKALVNELCKLRSNKGRLFILGVGGSAGNASHAVNDFRKLAGIESYAPTDNIPELTARTNDEGWHTVFSEFLKVSNFESRDALLILSVGGGNLENNVSTNLCNAIDYAKQKTGKIFGIVGKGDGYTGKHADICIVIPNVNNFHITPHSESFQAIIWHLLVSHPDLKINATKW